MTTDLALNSDGLKASANDIKTMVNRLYPMDQAIIMNTLRDISEEDMSDTKNLWRLVKTALSAVRNLQSDLRLKQDEIIEKNRKIKELESLITTDTLTKISNRRGFLEAFEKEMDRTNRGQTQGGLLIMIDLDNFKLINDTYGHAAGDEALRLVALTLTAHIRRMDVAARLGGDEFILIFSNANRIAAVDRVQKLARKLNSLTLKHEGYRIPIRASLGIQSYQKGDHADRVIQNADTHMYKAKESKKARQS